MTSIPAKYRRNSPANITYLELLRGLDQMQKTIHAFSEAKT